YTLNNMDSDTEALDGGDTPTDVFTVRLSDTDATDLGTDTQLITINVTGTNDAPILTANVDGDVAAGDIDGNNVAVDIVESGFLADGTTAVGGDNTVNGSFASADVDENDTNANDTFSIVSGGGQTQNTSTSVTGTYGTLTVGQDGAWIYTLDNTTGGAADMLDLGDTDSEVFTVQVADNNGGLDSKTVTIDIIGSNDAPVIGGTSTLTGEVDETRQLGSAVPMGPAETADSNATTLTANGTVDFSDVDADDTFTATIDGVTATGTSPATAFGAGILQGLLSLVDADGGTPGIQVAETGFDWNFSADENLFDYLAATESLILTYDLTLNDSDGGSDTTQVVVTVNGVDDGPVVVSTNPVNDTEGDSLVTVAGTELNPINVIPPQTAASDIVSINLLTDDTSPTSGVQITDIVEVDESNTPVIANATVVMNSGKALDGSDADVSGDLAQLNGSATAPGTPANLSFTQGVDAADIEGLFTVTPAGVVTYDRNHTIFDSLDAGERITVDINYDVVSGGDTINRTVTLTVEGENDAPFFTGTTLDFSVDVTELGDGDTSPDENTYNHVQSLSVSFDDIELTDNHTAFIVPVTGTGTPALGSYIGTFSSGFPQVATGTGAGEVTFQFTLNDGDIDQLTAGETVIQRYQVRISDGTELIAQDIVVTLTGTNDAPVITAVNDMGLSLIEDSNLVQTDASSTQQLSGDVVFDDVDVSDGLMGTSAEDDADTHTVTATFVSATKDMANFAMATLPTGTFAFDTNAANGSAAVSNTVTWTYTINDTDFDYLGDGEMLAMTFDIDVTDNSGATNDTATQQITITIEGTNDAPTIGVVDAGDMASASLTEANGALSVTDTLTVIDVDTTDEVTASVTSATINAGSSTGPDGGLTTADLESFFSITPAAILDGSTTTAQLTWTFDSDVMGAVEAFDFLAANETLIIDYVIEVDDANGSTDTQTVSVTINGTDDDPTIGVVAAGDSAAAMLTEGDAALMAFDTLTVGDVDITDEVTASVTSATRNAGSSTGPDGGLTTADLESFFSITPTAILNNSTTSAQLTWTFDSDVMGTVEAFNFLAANETLIIDYVIEVSDGSGPTDTQTVSVTITGTNDAPVISVAAGVDSDSAALTEADAGFDETGTLSVGDLDLTDTVSVGSVLKSSILTGTPGVLDPSALNGYFSVNRADVIDIASTTGTIDWNFNSGAEAFDFLDQGDVLTIVYDVTATDSETQDSNVQQVTLTITGTNDAPVLTANVDGDVTAGDITDNNVTVGIVEAGLDTDGTTPVGADNTVNGSFASADADADDTNANDTFSIVPSGGQSATSSTEVDGVYGTLTVDQNGAWIYTLDNTAGGAADQLAAGESMPEIFTIQVVDTNGGTDSQTVTINVAGSNDAPVISVEGGDTDSAPLTETDAKLTANGTLSVADIDLTDTVSVASALASKTLSGVTTSLPGHLDDATLATFFSVDATDVIGNAATSGTINWDFDSLTEAFDFLDQGDELTLVFNVTATDSQSKDSNIVPVTITITGTNDRPVIAAADTSALTETTDATGVPATLSDSGMLDLSDDDGDATHMISEIMSSVVHKDAADAVLADTAGGGNPPISPTLLTALDAAFSASLNTGDASKIDWAFDLTDTTVDFLAKDETLQMVYTITADDGTTPGVGDESNVSASQTVTVTITGTNDAPEITTAAVTDSVTEDGTTVADDPTTGATEAGAYLALTSTLDFSDLDLTDSHMAAAAFTSSDSVGVGQAADQQYGNLVASVTTQTNGSVPTGGVVTWDYAVDNAAVQFLAAGETITEVYTVTVSDGQGGTDTQTVSITINGTNDAPEVAVIGSRMLNEQIDTADLTDTIAVTFTDVDLNDVGHTASVTGATTTGEDDGLSGVTLADLLSAGTVTKATGSSNGSVDFTFTAGSGVFDYLAAGQHVEITYTVQIDDGETANNTGTQTVVVRVDGTNDAPVIDAIAPTTIAETTDTSNIADTISVTFTDEDRDDVGHTASITAATVQIGNGNGLTPAQLMALVTPGTVTKTADSTAGSVDLGFDAASTTFDYLGLGESVVIRYTLEVNDQETARNTATQTFDVIIDGTNDAPTLTIDASVAHMESVNDNFASLVDTALVSTSDGVALNKTLIAGTATLSDPDATDYSTGSLAIEVVGGDATDLLNFENGVTISGTGVFVGSSFIGSITSGALDDNALTITFNGNSTQENVQTLIQNINYRTSDDTPAASRDINLTLLDGDGGAAGVQTVTVNITAQNDSPTPLADSASANESSTAVFNVRLGIAAIGDEDSDPEQAVNDLTLVGITDVLDTAGDPAVSSPDSAGIAVSIPGTMTTDFGASVTANDAGLVTYDLTSPTAFFNSLGEGQTATDTFTYSLSDGQGGTTEATVSVEITGVNDAISASNDLLVVDENDNGPATGTTGDLVANDVDVDQNDTKEIISVVAGANVASVVATVSGFDVTLNSGVIVEVARDGTFAINNIDAASGQLTDVQNGGSFSYTVQDSGGTQATAVATFQITGDNDAPTVAAIT
ncbi:hypothetical protein DS909_08395, partial [Phaeobacter gallaeciensis]